jgi:hypothetical protein
VKKVEPRLGLPVHRVFASIQSKFGHELSKKIKCSIQCLGALSNHSMFAECIPKKHRIGILFVHFGAV